MKIDRETIFERCIPQVRKAWLAAADEFPDFLPVISDESRLVNEDFAQSVIGSFQDQMKSFPANPFMKRKWKRKTQDLINHALFNESIIGIHDYMDQRMIGEFQDELKVFFRHVRKFSPELQIEGIGQAARNYVVYAMFKEINNVKADFCTACFGYSMLYPFTDNYIDNPKISDPEKAGYNKMIRDKIEGHEVHPGSLHQKKTCNLLQMVESSHPRNDDPTASQLLLMMLEAQVGSIRQHDISLALDEDERLDISIYKGGISVLIDRFFVDKEITAEDLDFYFGFGFFLQLADDLQDIKEDGENGSQTVFTLDTSAKHEEKIVNKMLNFVNAMFKNYNAENDEFKKFILSNCFQLVYSSVIQSKEYFSDDFLENIERYLPVSSRFFEKIQNSIGKRNNSKNQEKYIKILDYYV
ncbi:MAG: hypothetical protein ACYCYI_06580 [Saccharofermentanales bacterium]